MKYEDRLKSPLGDSDTIISIVFILCSTNGCIFVSSARVFDVEQNLPVKQPHQM